MRQLHPLRLQYEFFSNANPLMAPIAALAEQVRNNRRPAADRQSVHRDAGEFVAANCRRTRRLARCCEAFAERMFMATYGSPTLQAASALIRQCDAAAATRPPKARCITNSSTRRIAELKSHIDSGGLREAVIRALLFAGMGRAAVDERGFETVRRIRQAFSDVPLAVFKATVREQFSMLLIDTEARSPRSHRCSRTISKRGAKRSI